MKTYIVWNPQKVYDSCNGLGSLLAESYECLLLAESLTSSKISSEVKTDDIDQVIDACLNEADVKLCYIEKPVMVKMGLSTDDWAELLHCLDACDGESHERIESFIKSNLPTNGLTNTPLINPIVK